MSIYQMEMHDHTSTGIVLDGGQDASNYGQSVKCRLSPHHRSKRVITDLYCMLAAIDGGRSRFLGSR